MAVRTSKMMKVAGLSLAGFVAVSIGVDKANIGPVASQLAGFCGAFAGAWMGSIRRRKRAPVAPPATETAGQQQPSEGVSETTTSG